MAASLAAKIEECLDIDVELEPTSNSGQFDVIADGKIIASRGGNIFSRVLLGAGYPNPDQVIDEIASRGS
jgi:hypothetical protein